MKDMNAIVLQPSSMRWRVVAVAICYIAGLILVANIAFGTSAVFGGSTGPARTGGYNTRLPIVAPVDSGKVAKAIIESTGGAPTIGQPLPADVPAPPTVTANPVASRPISITTTPTYTAATQVSTNPYASLLALIPTNLTFPPRGKPHHR